MIDFISCVEVSDSQPDPRLKDSSPFLCPFPSVLPDRQRASNLRGSRACWLPRVSGYGSTSWSPEVSAFQIFLSGIICVDNAQVSGLFIKIKTNPKLQVAFVHLQEQDKQETDNGPDSAVVPVSPEEEYQGRARWTGWDGG